MAMKKIFLILVLGWALTACKSAYFNTPNDLRRMPGTLYLTNGKSFSGEMSISTHNLFGEKMKLYASGDKKPMEFSLMEVQGYDLRRDYYALKEIRGGLQIGKRYSFMKRLTKEGSRIHLYENVEVVTTTGPNNISNTYYETQYYLQLPGESSDAVWGLGSTKFVPNFDEKMSKLLADCPALARKIADKEEGYFYAQVSLNKEKRANVLMQIIDEYNACK